MRKLKRKLLLLQRNVMRENENEDDDVEVIKECVMLENMLELETKMRDWSPWGMDKSTGHIGD